MADVAAIVAARVKGRAAEADALVLADQLVAAKADRARLRADLATLPGRITGLQNAVAVAQARVAAATQARDSAVNQHNAADAAAAAKEASAASLDSQAQDALDLVNELVAEHEQPGIIGAARKHLFDLQTAASAAHQQANAARAAANALVPGINAANAELTTAQSELAGAQGQLAAASAQLADAQSRQAAVEARPGTLSANITAQRAKVTTAWQAWDQLMTAALAAIVAPGADVEGLRAQLVAGDNPDDLAALVATDLPLALLPVRLETRFDAGNLLIRVYPDSVTWTPTSPS